MRLALGAQRKQVIGQLLLESALLAIAGAFVGMLFAHWTTKGILGSLPSAAGMENYLTATLDLRILTYSILLSLATVFIFGLFPAIHSTRVDLAPSLKDAAGQTTSSGGANLLRNALVTSQIAISLLLLISAGLFAKTLLNLKSVDIGIKIDHLMTFSLSPKLNKYSDEISLQ